jgi:hypothetical protein
MECETSSEAIEEFKDSENNEDFLINNEVGKN